MKPEVTLRVAIVLITSCSCLLSAQQTPTANSETTAYAVVPNVISYSGALTDLDGKPLSGIQGVTFLLYNAQDGGAPLWMETQNITPAKNGQYTVTLGSTTSQGLPADIFSSGEARWLAVQVVGQPEQARVLLVAVPYALKAADAQTIGGLPPSAFVLANGATRTISSSNEPRTNSSSQSNGRTPANPAVTGVGTIDYIPMWDSTSDIVDSVIFQKTSEVGIATTAPAATLDVNGKGDIRDTLTLFPKSTDNTVAVNGTTFKIASTGVVTFASGQTFPGAGTIMGITTASGSGLSGGGTTGTLSLKIPSAGVTNTMLADSKITLNANTAGGITTPGAMTLGSTYTIGLKACTKNQVLQYNGTSWACAAAGTGTITGVTTASGSGLAGGGTTGTLNLSIPSAGVSNTMLAHSAVTLNANTAGGLTVPGAMTLGSTYTIGLKPCTASQVLQYSGAAWNCANAGSGTITGVTAGTGLSGGGSSGSVTLNNSGVLSVTAGTGISSTGGQSPTLSINASVVPELSAANNFTANLSTSGELAAGGAPNGNTASGTIEVDAGRANTGSYGPGLLFGGGGESIASTRTSSAANAFGLNFFTNYTNRMTITNTGLVGINTLSPEGQLDVEATSSAGSYGIFANNSFEDAVGIAGFNEYASGSGIGVLGVTDGTAAEANGVVGQAINESSSNSLADGVYGVVINDGYGSMSGAGVFGQAQGESNLGSSLSLLSPVGLWGDGGIGNSIFGANAILGTIDDGTAASFENNSPSGWPTVDIYADNSNSTAMVLEMNGVAGLCEFANFGNSGGIGLYCSGGTSDVVPVDGGTRQVTVAPIESPNNWFEDAGSGQLTNGVAVIALDSEFLQTVNTGVDYKVFAMPNGDCKGLYVTHKQATSFEIRELGGGTSNVGFDYRIMAIRKNFENVRFADRTSEIEKRQAMRQRRMAKNTTPVRHDPRRRPILPAAKRTALNSFGVTPTVR